MGKIMDKFKGEVPKDKVINYPEEFRKKVEDVYPYHTFITLHKELEKGNSSAIGTLETYAVASISNDDIIEATSLKELQDRAKLLNRRWELYLEAKEFLKLLN